jgi:hypothetical protein
MRVQVSLLLFLLSEGLLLGSKVEAASPKRKAYPDGFRRLATES